MRFPYVTVKQRDFLVFHDFDDVVLFSRAGFVGPGIYGGKFSIYPGGPRKIFWGPPENSPGEKTCMGHIFFRNLAVE